MSDFNTDQAQDHIRQSELCDWCGDPATVMATYNGSAVKPFCDNHADESFALPHIQRFVPNMTDEQLLNLDFKSI